MKDLSLKQFYKMVIIGEGAVIILLAARMAVRILFGKSALTTALIFIVCVLTFWLIWMIFSHRVEKDDELSEINKMKANLSTFYMMTALLPFGFLFSVMYNIIAGKPPDHQYRYGQCRRYINSSDVSFSFFQQLQLPAP